MILSAQLQRQLLIFHLLVIYCHYNAYRCKSCHYNSFTSPDLTDANAYKSLTTGTNYVNISAPSLSVFYQSASNPDFSPFQMPDGIKLTEAEQATILEWIKQGAKP